MLVTVQPLKGKTAEEIPQDLKANMDRLSGYDIWIRREVPMLNK
jgi:hypothetical protein